jgi:uncharacterized membrane protein YqiK
MNNTTIPEIVVIVIVFGIVWLWIGIEKLIERREFKELIEKNSTKNKKYYIKGE